MQAAIPSHPIVSIDGAKALEMRLFESDDEHEWAAISRAGEAIAAEVLADFKEIGGFPDNGKVLVLVGKGHNGADALVAAGFILKRFPAACALVSFAFGERALRPLARRAWVRFSELGSGRVSSPGGIPSGSWDLCLDGVFGWSFRPPLPPPALRLLTAVNALPIRLKAAVDLPSGLEEAGAFRSDFTYATGSLKVPALCAHAGRVRYLDLGFFKGTEEGDDRVLLPDLLSPLAGLRRPDADKRSQGHLFIVGGSRSYPGAALMGVLSALRSGAGLITAFVPESLAAAFAARAPEAMWVGMPETASGGLSDKGTALVLSRLKRATALAIGSGLGEEPGSLKLARDLIESSPVPLLLDANALQPELVRTGSAARVLTPHAGEFARISNNQDIRTAAARLGAVVVLKGPVTRISGGGPVYHSLYGGPVLARGGSGDLLAGLAGGLLAQTPMDPLLAACRAVVWHGKAADLLARNLGQTAVKTTQWLDFLSPALRESASCRPS